VGDAVGTTVEFKPPGSFAPVTDMVGGGPFSLPAGAWTDDTSMALCLAESLVERRGFDPVDQLERTCAGTARGTGRAPGAALTSATRRGRRWSASSARASRIRATRRRRRRATGRC
jgi:ADP-ribosylglycohydrolase